MRLVIDASVAVKWFIDEPRHELAREVLVQSFELVAPDLILVEAANALRNEVRNGLANKADMAVVLARLPAMFESLLYARGVLADAFEMACQINHPVADCVYLACARASGGPLLTDDETFNKKAKGIGTGVKVKLLADWKPGLPATP